MKTLAHIVLLTLGAIWSECNIPNTLEPGPRPRSGVAIVEMDSARYAISNELARVSFRIRNDTDSTIYFYHCNRHVTYLAFSDSAGFERFLLLNNIACLAIYPSGYLTIAPDSSFADIITLPPGATWPGKFRFYFPFLDYPDGNFTDTTKSSLIELY